MKTNVVGWFEIYVQDMPRARAFYEAVLSVKLERFENSELDMWTFPMLPEATGASGALVRVPDFPSGGNSTLVYFECEDCAVAEAKVVENGGRIMRPKMSIGEHGFITLAYDTENNMFGLHSLH